MDRNTPRRPSWISGELLAKIRGKNAARRRHQRTHNSTDWNHYAHTRNQTRWETRKAKANFASNLASNAKSNPEAVFKHINSKLKTRPQIPALQYQDTTFSTDKGKATALNNFFGGVFTEETQMIPDFTITRPPRELPPLHITPEEV
jgi:hypothetical protein